ncbi:MAG: MoxR family ATPase, partial [Rhodospirillales bacterium]|nr:MoxR family ATPase [Rhodospirillales bacterium]
ELEGTYPLPEAQLDRFFMQVDVEYPDLEAERQIMIHTTGVSEAAPAQVMDAATLIAAQKLIRQVPVGESVAEAILSIVRAGRPESSDIDEVQKHVSWGPGPRASQALMLGVRARAVIEGRLAPSIDDILALAHPILRHRMALTFSARAEGVTLEHVIDRMCERVA